MSGRDPDAYIRNNVNDLPVYEFARTPFTPPKPLSECTVAIVTTAGLRPDGVHHWAPGDQSFVELSADAADLQLAHFSPNFDRSGYAADHNVVFPVDRLRELAEQGVIGAVAPRHYSFMGGQPDHELSTMRLDSGPAAAARMKAEGVDVVLLTPV